MKTFLGISSFQVLAVFRRGLFFSYLTIYLRHYLGLSVTATTLFATLPMIVNVLAQRYIWGALSDRLQKRRALIIWGEILGGIGTIGLYYAHRLPETPETAGWVLILGMCVVEVVWSMSNIGWSALIADIYRKGNRSLIMGRLESMGGMGRIAGVLTGGLLYDRMGTAFQGWGFYEGSLFWVSGVIMFLSVFPMLLVPEGGMTEDDTPGDTTSDAAAATRHRFYIFLAAVTLIHFGRNAVALPLPQYLILESGLNLSSLTLSHVLNLRSLGLIVTGFFAGALGRRFGDRTILAAASGVAALSLFIIGITESLTWICLSSFLMGFSEVLILAASYELASAYIPADRRGKDFALFNAAFFLSWGVAATLIAGPVADGLLAMGRTETQAYMASFNTCGLVTLAGVITLIFLYAQEKKHHEVVT
ncbi:MAG: MFS transporter [Desulfobacterales bacterium]|nr:MFS transporter [Desulfobacterales bacterium]